MRRPGRAPSRSIGTCPAENRYRSTDHGGEDQHREGRQAGENEGDANEGEERQAEHAHGRWSRLSGPPSASRMMSSRMAPVRSQSESLMMK